MKKYLLIFTAIACIFSLNCFGQNNDIVLANVKMKNAKSKSDKIPNTDLVVESYRVEETINMAFGNRTTTYEVSKLGMVNTYDLGPNNTRKVIPQYAKPKEKTLGTTIETKTIVDTLKVAVKPVKVNVLPPAKKEKYITINVVNTYEKVLDRGYKSIEMLKKVADRSYFENDMINAAKHYAQLFEMSTNLEASYYFRYAQALKGINEMEKSEEMMQLFKSKNGSK